MGLKRGNKIITQEKLKEILGYDPLTGVFVWRVASARKIKIGDVAGNLYSSGYLYIGFQRKLYRAHTLAWLYIHGVFPRKMVDHIDGNPSNNSIRNLRECSASENQKNRKMNSNNTSGYKGVSFDKSLGRWRATGATGNKTIHIGFFDTPEEAGEAYQEFAKANHGEFYRDTLS